MESPSKLRAEFLPSREPFSLPTDMASLDAATKRQLTICNLFNHHHQSVSDIIRVLDETDERVIRTLLENRLILDRRKEAKTFSGSNRQRSRALSDMAAADQGTGFARRLRSTNESG
jgi:hypothetical protein